ncbi:hypothetical protein [Paracraurococcus ruber]|uniref:DUF4089 domain-containing protein n=1 Tax=Paracraurococcus ruber TaxID=77675 RepID=A0ABS1CZT5_9PROT|nr:hypothetical protein [Paracraurococcus ruber]MBK1660045.1 hypothetical protein [Paracraurococcus ruber]TDG30237.1 hypothetical protein E2C05_15130 [Paracraurococcus ruber]
MNDTEGADFQALLRIAGITIPAARYDIMLDAYRHWLELVKVLDEPMPMAEEPAAAPRFGGEA